MFSSGAYSPGQGQGGGEGDAGMDGGNDEASPPWGASGPGGNLGKGGSWQGSSSLSWLTNLRKGIMSGGALLGETGGGEGGAQFVHGRSRMTVDLGIPTMPGRSTSSFHQPGEHRVH